MRLFVARLIRHQSLSLFNYDVRAIVVEFAGITTPERGIRNSVGRGKFSVLGPYNSRSETDT